MPTKKKYNDMPCTGWFRVKSCHVLSWRVRVMVWRAMSRLSVPCQNVSRLIRVNVDPCPCRSVSVRVKSRGGSPCPCRSVSVRVFLYVLYVLYVSDAARADQLMQLDAALKVFHSFLYVPVPWA